MDEYISKQKVLDYLNGYLHSLGDGGAEDLLFVRGQRRALINSIQDILAVKAADVQPVVHGRWIISNIYAQCSECSVAYDLDTFQRLIPLNENVPRHCSYCGARMDGGIDG